MRHPAGRSVGVSEGISVSVEVSLGRSVGVSVGVSVKVGDLVLVGTSVGSGWVGSRVGVLVTVGV